MYRFIPNRARVRRSSPCCRSLAPADTPGLGNALRRRQVPARLRHQPLGVGDDLAALRSIEVDQESTFGSDALARGKRQTRVIAGDGPVLDAHLQPLDQIGTVKGVDHVAQGL